MVKFQEPIKSPTKPRQKQIAGSDFSFPCKKRNLLTMSGISRLFKPSNDKSIVRNLLTDNSEYEKIRQRSLTVNKKTEMAILKEKIEKFTTRWNYKGLCALWNPIFLAEFMAIKMSETKQTPGQKIFLCVWIHPLLLSLRCGLYCPAIGYKQADLDIMTKSVTKIEDNINIIHQNNVQGLATAKAAHFVPDSFFPDQTIKAEINPDDSKVENFKSTAETEDAGIKTEVKMEAKPVIVSHNPPKSLPSLPKPATTMPSLAVKSEGNIKKVITVSVPSYYDMNVGHTDCYVKMTTNYDPYHLCTDNDFVEPTPFMSRVLIIYYPKNNDFRLTVNNNLVNLAVIESAKSDDDFSSDLDSNYLDNLFNTCTPKKSDTSLSSLTLTADAPKCHRQRPLCSTTDDVSNMSLERLFNEEIEDEKEKSFIILNDSSDSGIVIRQYKSTWKASTPDGKLLKGGKGQYSPQ